MGLGISVNRNDAEFSNELPELKKEYNKYKKAMHDACKRCCGKK